MNKTWIVLISLAILTVLIMVGYEFFLSFTGQRSTFAKPETPQIDSDLGSMQLEYANSLKKYVLVDNKTLDGK